MTSDAIEDDDQSLFSNPSDIEEFDEVSKEQLEDISDNESQNFDANISLEEVQSNVLDIGNPHGTPMALDSAITHAQAQVTNESFNSGCEDIPVPSKTAVRSDSEVGSEVMVGSAAMVGSVAMVGSAATGECPCDSVKPGREVVKPSREVVQDKEWVVLGAGILERNGKGAAWTEIADIWKGLQRSWERIEVRPVFSLS